MSDKPGSPQDHTLVEQRRRKLEALRAEGNAFPNDFRRSHWAAELQDRYADADREALEALAAPATVAGRMMAKRVQGKVSFVRLQDGSGSIQLFVQREALGEARYQWFKGLDVGDILGAEGTVFRTNRGELSIRVSALRLLVKSLQPLPEKWHGLADQELRYRRRYLDLMMNAAVCEVFRRRSAIIQALREFMTGHGFQEVETPMMHPIPGGAAARPFITRHNALSMELYLRIAPELYLKRLLVGGLERVFEINRSFRNEGLSTRHNPEFTMLEFYQAYADYQDFMRLIEQLMREVAQQVLGTLRFEYAGHAIDLAPEFRRLTLKQAVLEHNPSLAPAEAEDAQALRRVLGALGREVEAGHGPGKLLLELFESTVEERLVAPTFVTQYPAEVSPLARTNDDDPFVTDRFELFIGGREIANGFSELNDPEDQAARFRAQAAAKEAGDDEAMHYDGDYVRALEYGLPPAAGAGIGVDRLVMLLTDSASIRDVLLFPLLRPEGS